jgi:1-deoxy-D-xylulose-5-phosphate reductoisomerase
VDFYKLGALHFEKPDFSRFPCLGLAYQAAEKLGSAPCVLNAANEVCVEAFLEKKISFVSIPKVIEKVLSRNRNIPEPDLSDIYQADNWAREEARRVIANA